MYGVLALTIGAVITIMNDVNSQFTALAGSLFAVVGIHVAGLVTISAILLVRREQSRPGLLPVQYYLGGFVGVGTVFSSTYAFNALGASLAVALALLGQSLFSLVVDATGFMGRRKYPLTTRTLPGVFLTISGVVVMAGNWRSDALAMLIGLSAGVLTGLSFTFNSELGNKKGVFHATLINYIVGLSTVILVIAVARPSVQSALHSIAAIRAAGASGLFVALCGGILGVGVVAVINLVFPRIPAFSATLLIFSGQAMSGVIVDAVSTGAFDVRRVAGTLLVLAGLAANALLARRGEAPRAAGPAE